MVSTIEGIKFHPCFWADKKTCTKVPSFSKAADRKLVIDGVLNGCLESLKIASQSPPQQLKETIKVTTRALNRVRLNSLQVACLHIAKIAKGIFRKDTSQIKALLASNAEAKKQIRTFKHVKPAPAAERKEVITPLSNNHSEINGALSFFNNYFPNVVVVGNYEGKDGTETRRQLDELGIKYDTRGPFDGATIPPDVWSKLSNEIDQDDGKVRIPLSEKVKSATVLTEEEKSNHKKIKGTAACFMLHRDVLVKTMDAYDSAVAELEALKKLPSSEEHKKALEETSSKIAKFSSVFIFEHNGRFGYVDKDNKVSLPKEIKEHVSSVLSELPEDWEFFTLFSNDIYSASAKVPEDLSRQGKYQLIHPGVGMTTKGFAVSSKMYADLRELFNKITPKSATEIFYPIDAHIYRLSREAQSKGRRFQLAPTRSMMYRAAGESFHSNHNDPNSYAARNLPGSTYEFTAVKKI